MSVSSCNYCKEAGHRIFRFEGGKKVTTCPKILRKESGKLIQVEMAFPPLVPTSTKRTESSIGGSWSAVARSALSASELGRVEATPSVYEVLAAEKQKKHQAWLQKNAEMEAVRKAALKKKEKEHADKMYEKYGPRWFAWVNAEENCDLAIRLCREEDDAHDEMMRDVDAQIAAEESEREERHKTMTEEEIRDEGWEEEDNWYASCATEGYFEEVKKREYATKGWKY